MIFSNINWHFGLVYLVTVMIISMTPKQHVDNAWKAPLLLYKAGATLKVKTAASLATKLII